MADFIRNLIMILIFTLSDFFFRLHTEIIIYKEIDRFKTTVFSFLRLTIGLLREATVLL